MTTAMRTKPEVGSERSTLPIAIAAGSSAMMALIYLLIGLRVIEVIQPSDDQPEFGFAAAIFFAVLTAVVLRIRRPAVWLVAIAIHLFVAYVYIDLAGERVPDYETWGLILRGLQIPAVLALAWLTMNRNQRHPSSPESTLEP